MIPQTDTQFILDNLDDIGSEERRAIAKLIDGLLNMYTRPSTRQLLLDAASHCTITDTDSRRIP